MKKNIWTESKKLNELFTKEELDFINWVVNDHLAKALIIKPITEWATIYLDFDWEATVSDWYPISSWDSISFEKWNLSRVQICSDTADTDIRILFV